MNHTADIRSVRPGDAPQLAHIQTESWKAAFREIIPADILSEYTDPEPVTRMYEHLLTHGIAHGYILERDGAPPRHRMVGRRQRARHGRDRRADLHPFPAGTLASGLWQAAAGEGPAGREKRRIPLHPALGIRCQSACHPVLSIPRLHRQRQKASLLRFRGGDVYQGPLTPTTAQKARRRSICGGPFPQIKNSPEALP